MVVGRVTAVQVGELVVLQALEVMAAVVARVEHALGLFVVGREARQAQVVQAEPPTGVRRSTRHQARNS